MVSRFLIKVLFTPASLMGVWADSQTIAAEGRGGDREESTAWGKSYPPGHCLLSVKGMN